MKREISNQNKTWDWKVDLEFWNLYFYEVSRGSSSNQLQEQITIMEDLEEKLETLQMMQVAKTGFSEWNDEEENIYDA